jgi:uncharacterized protein YciI
LAAGVPEPYFVAFLRPDPGRGPMSAENRQRVMGEHLANIRKLAAEGVIVAAGPMEDRITTISGIFIFKVPALGDARRIAAQDPTVTAGRNTVDVHAWAGPPGIGASYFAWKRDHPGDEDQMSVHALCILKRGPRPGAGAPPIAEHARFVGSLRSMGMLAAAGQFDDDPDLLGIVIFKTPSIVDARMILGDDPAVQSGLVCVECHRWWTADGILPW